MVPLCVYTMCNIVACVHTKPIVTLTCHPKGFQKGSYSVHFHGYSTEESIQHIQLRCRYFMQKAAYPEASNSYDVLQLFQQQNARFVYIVYVLYANMDLKTNGLRLFFARPQTRMMVSFCKFPSHSISLLIFKQEWYYING